MLLAAVLGAGPAADAFVVAFRIPGLFRRVLGEGALNGGLVPLDARIRRERGEDAARAFAGEALGATALAMLALVGLAELLAPALVLALASGYAGDALRFDLATRYTRLMLPLLAATMLTAVASAFLNAQRRFTAAAIAPVAVNLVLVAVLLVLNASDAPPERLGLWLAAATTAGGAAHLVVLAVALARMPGPPRFAWPRWSADLKRMLALGLPGLMAVAAGQLSIVVATQAASQTPAAVARLYYADRLFQLPLGFVAAGAGVVLLPELARLAAVGQAKALEAAVGRSLEWAMLLVLPAAVALVVLAGPIVSVLFQHGEFDAQDASATAEALAALAPGLPLAALVRVLTQPFLAREATRIPLLAAASGVVATAFASFALAVPYGVAGVAAGVTLGAAVHAAALAVSAWLAGLWRPGLPFALRMGRIALSCLGMAIVVIAMQGALGPSLTPEAGTAMRLSALAVLCLGGAAVYGALALLTRAGSLAELRGRG